MLHKYWKLAPNALRFWTRDNLILTFAELLSEDIFVFFQKLLLRGAISVINLKQMFKVAMVNYEAGWKSRWKS